MTFALEASRRGRRVVLLESEDQVGGLARTLRFGDFRFDIGGHRFHSRWPEITQWVLEVLDGDAAEVPRRSRIRLDGRYVDYPLRFPNALAAFNPWQATRILASYLWAASPRLRRRLDVSFEDWIVRRFGRSLYDISSSPTPRRSGVFLVPSFPLTGPPSAFVCPACAQPCWAACCAGRRHLPRCCRSFSIRRWASAFCLRA